MAKNEPSGEWWASVVHAFQAHVRDEGEFLERYQQAVDGVDDPALRFLLQMILDDERRHHALFEQMADAARGDTPTAGDLPGAPHPDTSVAATLLAPTERLLDAEREDRDRLRHLARDLEALRDDTLWHLLVGLMEIDTQKHIAILEYLRKRLRAAAGS